MALIYCKFYNEAGYETAVALHVLDESCLTDAFELKSRIDRCKYIDINYSTPDQWAWHDHTVAPPTRQADSIRKLSKAAEVQRMTLYAYIEYLMTLETGL